MKKFFLFISIILILASFLYCGFANNVAGIAFLLTGCIFLFLAFIPDLAKYIKEVNFKDGKILTKELKDSLSELRMLAKINAEAIFQLSQLQGRFYIPRMEIDKLNRYSETVRVLKELKIPEEEILKLTDEKWHWWVENDYYIHIKSKMREKFLKSEKYASLELKEKNEFEQKYKNRSMKTPQGLLNFATEFDIDIDQEIKTMLEDYDYYVKNKFHNDEKRWLKYCGAEEEEE